MSINITNVARNSISFSLVGLFAGVIGIPISIYVTAILSPEQYGIYGILMLWLTYALLISPGFAIAGRREIPVYLGQRKGEAAKRVQNISLSGELLCIVFPFSVIVIASFFFSEPIMKFGLLMVAVAYLSTQLAGFWGGIIFIREQFGLAVKGNLILAILVPVLTVAAINWLGIYSLVLAPLIANTVVWIFYLKVASVEFHFTWDTHEVARLFRVGIVLQLSALVYWGFRLADRTIVASMLPLGEMGLYTAAVMFVTYAQVLPTDFTKVLTPILWRASTSGGFKDAGRIAIYVALATAIAIPFTQLIVYLIREVITPQYIGSISVFNILSYNIYLAMVCTAPAIILSSSVANKQNIMLVAYIIGLSLEIGLAILLIKLGYGITGVALSTVVAQGILTTTTFVLAYKYMFTQIGEALKCYLLILLPFVIAIAFYFVHSYMSTHIDSRLQFTTLSITAQVAIWNAAIYCIYKQYVSVDKIKSLASGLLAKVSTTDT